MITISLVTTQLVRSELEVMQGISDERSYIREFIAELKSRS